MTVMYSSQLKGELRSVMHAIDVAAQLRKLYPPEMLFYQAMEAERTVSQKCNSCYRMLKAEFGDYTKALDEKYVKCPGGRPEEKHGYWASVININLN